MVEVRIRVSPMSFYVLVAFFEKGILMKSFCDTTHLCQG